MNTKVTLAGVELKNPVMTCSGTFGSGMEYGEMIDLDRLGAVVTKGIANVPWPGNPTPRVTEVYGGMLNAIGLQGPMKLNSSHIEFVFDCISRNTTEIRNIKKYLLAVLFNAPSTINGYYTALVAHDMNTGSWGTP